MSFHDSFRMFDIVYGAQTITKQDLQRARNMQHNAIQTNNAELSLHAANIIQAWANQKRRLGAMMVGSGHVR